MIKRDPPYYLMENYFEMTKQYCIYTHYKHKHYCKFA